MTRKTADVRDFSVRGEAKFLEGIKPDLKEIEKIRLRMRSLFLQRLFAGIFLVPAIITFLIYVLVYDNAIDPDGLLARYVNGIVGTAIVIFILATYVWVRIPLKNYISTYKTIILPRLADLFGNFTYNQENYYYFPALEKYILLPKFDIMEWEDEFRGEYKNTKILFGELKLVKYWDSKNKIWPMTKFRGLVITLKVPDKNFSGHTVLTDKCKTAFSYGEKRYLGLREVRFIDSEFERKYDVFTNDQVEARYLIDPVMLEQLRDLSELLQSEKITVAWRYDKMRIASESKRDHFEPPSIFDTAIDNDNIRIIYQEIAKIINIIDHLDYVDKKRNS